MRSAGNFSITMVPRSGLAFDLKLSAMQFQHRLGQRQAQARCRHGVPVILFSTWPKGVSALAISSSLMPMPVSRTVTA